MSRHDKSMALQHSHLPDSKLTLSAQSPNPSMRPAPPPSVCPSIYCLNPPPIHFHTEHSHSISIPHHPNPAIPRPALQQRAHLGPPRRAPPPRKAAQLRRLPYHAPRRVPQPPPRPRLRARLLPRRQEGPPCPGPRGQRQQGSRREGRGCLLRPLGVSVYVCRAVCLPAVVDAGAVLRLVSGVCGGVRRGGVCRLC